MEPGRTLRDLLAQLAGEGGDGELGGEQLLGAHGFGDLPPGLLGEAITSFAHAAPIEVAEHLAPFVVAHTTLGADAEHGLDLLASTPSHAWSAAAVHEDGMHDVDALDSAHVHVMHAVDGVDAAFGEHDLAGDLDFGHGHEHLHDVGGLGDQPYDDAAVHDEGSFADQHPALILDDEPVHEIGHHLQHDAGHDAPHDAPPDEHDHAIEPHHDVPPS